MTIRIKNTTILRALMEKNYHPILIDVICYVSDTYGIVITEAWRKPRHNSDVHATTPCRGIDLREWIYPDALAYKIMDDVNSRWEYDHLRPDMKVMIIHKTKKGAKHMHTQVHSRTKRRTK